MSQPEVFASQADLEQKQVTFAQLSERTAERDIEMWHALEG